MFGSKTKSDSREGMTLVAEEAYFHGTLTAKGSLRIEGTFEGDISDAVDVVIGPKGRLLGDVAAESLTVAGEVVGNVVAARSVELFATARVSGDVRTPKLKIDEGAFFDGVCAMGEGSDKPRRRRLKSETEPERPADAVT